MGCGIGRVEKYLSPYCMRLYAVDVSDRMLAYARKRLAGIPNIELHRNNGLDLAEFPDGTFDLVFALLVFHHLGRNDTQMYLQEIIRVLKIDGTVYLQFANRLSPHFSRANIEKRRYDVARTRWYAESEAITMLQAVGFQNMTSALGTSEITRVCKK